MANINDYLRWRGDVKITKEYPFNEIDSMILARFSYLLFDRINMKKTETIADISFKMKDFPNEDFLYNGDKELITNLGESRRFKDLKVTDYVENNNKNTEEQFGAITIHISSRELYISFIGTDRSIFGWKEDFNMGFMDTVPCQIAGRDYAYKISLKYPHKKIRIGGHSKGGNVAIYAAITNPRRFQNKIIKVYNYDGPGFSKDIINKYETDDIIKKIETYIPQDSIIGRVLNHKEKTTIALSLEKGILEHDIFSWQVFRDDLIKVEKNTESSENIDKTLTNWVENTTNEQRKIFIDIIFDLFYSTNANTFGEIVKDLKGNIPKMLKKYGQLSKNDKKVLTDMVIKLVKTNMIVIKDSNVKKIINKKDEYLTLGKEKISELDERYLSRLRKKGKDE